MLSYEHMLHGDGSAVNTAHGVWLMIFSFFVLYYFLTRLQRQFGMLSYCYNITEFQIQIINPKIQNICEKTLDTWKKSFISEIQEKSCFFKLFLCWSDVQIDSGEFWYVIL